MKKFCFALSLCLLAFCFDACARVVFLPRAETSISGSGGSTGPSGTCQNAGYTFTSCGNGTPVQTCPYANGYYSACCINGHLYTTSTCSGHAPVTEGNNACSYSASCE